VVGAIFTIRQQNDEHWGAARRAGFWETKRRIEVEPGDPLLFWLTGAKHLLGVAEASREVERATYSNAVPRPWNDDESYEYRYWFEPVDLDLPTATWQQLVVQLGLKPTTSALVAPLKLDRALSQVVADLTQLGGNRPPVDLDAYRHHRRQSRDRASVGPEWVEPTGGPTRTKTGKVFSRDPQVVDRGLAGHENTVVSLARWLRDQGVSATTAGAVNYDLEWTVNGQQYVAEVKSLRDQNELSQIRLGIGEVLDFSYQLGGAIPVLVVEQEPVRVDRWMEVCRGAGIRLVWPGSLDEILPWGPIAAR